MKKVLNFFVCATIAFLVAFTSFTTSTIVSAAEGAISYEKLYDQKKQINETDVTRTIEFSKAVNESTLAGNVTLYDETAKKDIPVETVVSETKGNHFAEVSLSGSNQYEVGHTYTLYVGPGVKDAKKGQELKENIKFDFEIISNSTEEAKPVSGTIEKIETTAVTIDGQSYGISEAVAGIFNTGNEAALTGANITAIVDQTGTVIEVQNLTIAQDGTMETPTVLDAKGATISNSLHIGAEYVEVKNLTVQNFIVSGDIETSVVAEKVNVTGKALVEEETNLMKAASADKPATRVTITFKDSTVVTMEIKKRDMYFRSEGKTEVTEISLFANAEIFVDPDVVLPKLSIFQGVTNIELNATIANVVIDSNDDIAVSGSGNFENVEINTNKSVTLETTGHIKNVNVKNGESTLSLGEEVTIENVKVPEEKSLQEIINNYEDVKDQLDVVIDEEDLQKFLAAKFIYDKEEFGLATIAITGRDNHIIKYMQYDWNDHYEEPAKKGEVAPQKAVTYNDGDIIKPWVNKQHYVYKVDKNNVILESFEIDDHFYEVHDMKIKDNQFSIKVLYDIEHESPDEIFKTFQGYQTGQNIEKTDFSDVQWKYDENNIPYIEFAIPGVTLDTTNMMYYGLQLRNNGTLTYYNHQFNSDRDEVLLYALKQISSTTPTDSELETLHDWMFDHIVETYAYVEREVVSGDEKYTTQDSLAVGLQVVMDAYRAEFVKGVESGEKVKEIVLAVNEQYKELIAQYGTAYDAIEALYKEDRHRERLKDTTTLEDIKNARAIIEKLPDSIAEQREDLLNDVDYAEYEWVEAEISSKYVDYDHSDELLPELTIEDIQNFIADVKAKINKNSRYSNSITHRLEELERNYYDYKVSTFYVQKNYYELPRSQWLKEGTKLEDITALYEELEKVIPEDYENRESVLYDAKELISHYFYAKVSALLESDEINEGFNVTKTGVTLADVKAIETEFNSLNINDYEVNNWIDLLEIALYLEPFKAIYVKNYADLPAHEQFKTGVTAEQISELLTKAESITFYRENAKDYYEELVNYALRQFYLGKVTVLLVVDYEELSEDKWLLPTTTIDDVNAVREELNNGNSNVTYKAESLLEKVELILGGGAEFFKYYKSGWLFPSSNTDALKNSVTIEDVKKLREKFAETTSASIKDTVDNIEMLVLLRHLEESLYIEDFRWYNQTQWLKEDIQWIDFLKVKSIIDANISEDNSYKYSLDWEYAREEMQYFNRVFAEIGTFSEEENEFTLHENVTLESVDIETIKSQMDELSDYNPSIVKSKFNLVDFVLYVQNEFTTLEKSEVMTVDQLNQLRKNISTRYNSSNYIGRLTKEYEKAIAKIDEMIAQLNEEETPVEVETQGLQETPATEGLVEEPKTLETQESVEESETPETEELVEAPATPELPETSTEGMNKEETTIELTE